MIWFFWKKEMAGNAEIIKFGLCVKPTLSFFSWWCSQSAVVSRISTSQESKSLKLIASHFPHIAFQHGWLSDTKQFRVMVIIIIFTFSTFHGIDIRYVEKVDQCVCFTIWLEIIQMYFASLPHNNYDMLSFPKLSWWLALSHWNILSFLALPRLYLDLLLTAKIDSM